MIRARSSRVSSAGAATLRASTRGSLCASGAAVNAPRLRLASDTCSYFAASYDRRDASDDDESPFPDDAPLTTTFAE